MTLQLKEAEERRLSRSCSKSPGIRGQESPITFPQPAVNPDQKTPELKIQEFQDSTIPADPKITEPKTSEPGCSESEQLSPKPTSPPEEKGTQVKNPDTNATDEPKTKVQAMKKEPKPKPSRKYTFIPFIKYILGGRWHAPSYDICYMSYMCELSDLCGLLSVAFILEL